MNKPLFKGAINKTWQDLVCRCHRKEQKTIGEGYTIQINEDNTQLKIICPSCGKETVVDIRRENR